MPKKNRRFLRPSLLATLILLTLFFSATNCRKPEPVLVPIGDAKVVVQLPNGNWEVTPAFILEFGAYKGQVAILTLELKKCREEKKP